MDIKTLQEAKKAKKITYDELAAITGYSRRSIIRILKGETVNPGTETVKAIKKALDITEGESLGNSIVLREDEKRLLYAYNLLSEAMKEHLIALAENAAHVPSVKQNRA